MKTAPAGAVFFRLQLLLMTGSMAADRVNT
jgi:hypothetical protein